MKPTKDCNCPECQEHFARRERNVALGMTLFLLLGLAAVVATLVQLVQGVAP